MSTPRTNRVRPLALLLTGMAAWLTAPGIAAPAAGGDFAAQQAEAKKSFREGVTPFVTTYCLRCHGQDRQKGGINFQPALNNPGSGDSAMRWRQAIANVRTHDMPPKDAKKQPTEEERQQFLGWIGKIKFLSPKDPGLFVIRRLTKAEYGNTLHDLFGVDPAIAEPLPDDVPGEGFMNTLSPLQLEQYLEIANGVLDRVLPPGSSPTTAVQRRLFGGVPRAGTDSRAAARNVARALARKAFRRPPSEEELRTLLGVHDLATENGLSYPEALRLMVKAILVSPQFLFITPAGANDPGRDIVPLDDHQLASRLSYLLWSTLPDAELSRLADRGRLHEPSVLRSQARRLLKDRRARAFFDGFGAQWLGLGNLGTKEFDPVRFPQMTREMRTAMYEEALLFFQGQIRENRSVVGFVDADYTFLNGTLAPLYGLEEKVTGPKMRRVRLSDVNRGGILGMPGVLAATSFPNRTSPVKRGVWVLEQLLGQRVPPPPPNVPALDRQDQNSVANLTLRQRTELHTTDAVCANCHRILDPIGFGLENFDAIGRWREQDDAGGPIDATGELPGGVRFSSPKELKAALSGQPERLARNLTERMMAYALCRQLEGHDEIVVDQLMETIARDGYRLQTIITEIVTSYPFTHRRINPPTEPRFHEK